MKNFNIVPIFWGMSKLVHKCVLSAWCVWHINPLVRFVQPNCSISGVICSIINHFYSFYKYFFLLLFIFTFFFYFYSFLFFTFCLFFYFYSLFFLFLFIILLFLLIYTFIQFIDSSVMIINMESEITNWVQIPA